MKNIFLGILAVVAGTRLEASMYVADDDDFSYLLTEIMEEPPVYYSNV
jgi:hypothetical protein